MSGRKGQRGKEGRAQRKDAVDLPTQLGRVPGRARGVERGLEGLALEERRLAILERGLRGEGEVIEGGEHGGPFLSIIDLRLAAMTQQGRRNLRIPASHPSPPQEFSGILQWAKDRTGTASQSPTLHPHLNPLGFSQHPGKAREAEPATPLQMGRLSPREGMWLPEVA